MNDQDGPVYVVLGATGGIGGALCRRTARTGARLVLAARDADRLKVLAHEVGGDIVTTDATQSADVDQLIAEAKERHGRIDGVANLVGSVLVKPAHRTTDEEFAEALALNLTSAFNVTRAAAKVLQRQQQGGAIVLMSSAVASRGVSNHEAIAAAKGGVVALTRAAAATYANKGVRVNCVSPGMTETPLVASLLKTEGSRRASEALHPNGRIAQPEQVASAVAWLLDPEQSQVTGQVLGVDGGLGALQPTARG